MRLKLKRPLIFFDLETTGLDPERDRIIEMAAVKLWPDGRREDKKRRCNPGCTIPVEATAIHGISNDDVKHEPMFEKFAKGIVSYFQDCDLAGYNITFFDVPMLMAELDRAGHVLDLSGVAIVDTYRIYQQKEPRDLAGAMRFYCGREHSHPHDALSDVHATIDVTEAQLNRYTDLPDTPYELDQYVRDPEGVDRRGKLKWVNGEITVNFGRHRGRTLRFLAREEPDYIRWMIDNKVVGDAAHHLHDALLGHFAQK